jgi:hypothetical protein
MLTVRTLALISLTFGLCSMAKADSWAAPVVREVFSQNRDHFVRVNPGSNVGETFGFAGAPTGSNATAEFFVRQADRSYRLQSTTELLNPVAPVDILVSDSGALVTIDNWHNLGYGRVVTILDPGGRTVAAYSLEDLFAPAEIGMFSRSVSSRHWHNGPVYINKDQRTLYMMIESGRDLVVGLETGRFAFCETRADKYLCRNSSTQGGWLPYSAVVPER